MSSSPSGQRKVAGKPAGTAQRKPSRAIVRPPAAVKALAKPREFTKKQLDEMRLRFMLVDTNQDGLLSREELTNFAKLYGVNPSFVPLAFLLFDKEADNEGALSFTEFMDFMAVAGDFDRDKRGFYHRVFKAIDVNNSGAISAPELCKFCTYMGGTLTEQEADDVIKSMDYTGTGKLIWDDLCHWLGLPRGK